MGQGTQASGCPQVWDVTTEDLCSGTVTLDGFRGLVFVGGFSYADVLGSAKGEKLGVPPPLNSRLGGIHTIWGIPGF